MTEHLTAEKCSKALGCHCATEPTRARCFACGEAACHACTALVRYLGYGRRRLCFDCIVDHAYDGQETEAAKVVDFYLNVKPEAESRHRRWASEMARLRNKLHILKPSRNGPCVRALMALEATEPKIPRAPSINVGVYQKKKATA